MIEYRVLNDEKFFMHCYVIALFPFQDSFGLITVSASISLPFTFSSFDKRSSRIHSIMDCSPQPRDDLQILRLVEVLSILGDLRCLGLSLLLRLSYLDPLLHSEMLTQLGKYICGQAQTVENRTFDGVQNNVVVWSARRQYRILQLCKRRRHSPSKVQDSKTIHVCLISWWSTDTMDG